MKTLLLSTFLLILGAVAVSSISQAKSDEIEMSCLREFKVNGRALYHSYEMKPEDVEMNIKCAIECYYKKLDFYDHDTNEYSHTMAEKLYPKAAEAPCEKIEGTGRCDFAYKISKCYHNHDVRKVFT